MLLGWFQLDGGSAGSTGNLLSRREHATIATATSTASIVLFALAAVLLKRGGREGRRGGGGGKHERKHDPHASSMELYHALSAPQRFCGVLLLSACRFLLHDGAPKLVQQQPVH